MYFELSLFALEFSVVWTAVRVFTRKIQENNRKNRLSDRDGNGVVKSCSGTISIAHHAHRMATQNGGNPVPKESVFNRTHKRNKGKGPFVDKKSKQTSETYTKLKEVRSQGSGNTVLSPQGSCTFIPEAWAEACGGVKNGCSYGFGKSNSGSFTSSGTIPSNNTSNLEVEQLKEELQNMKNKQAEMDEKINQLLAISRASYANFSGHHFSPGQYSSPQYSAPSPGQYPASAPVGQYPSPAPAPTGQYLPTATATAPHSAPAQSQYTVTGSGQYPPPVPGYYPAPPPGYFMTPASQFHVPSNYVAPGQHPPVPTQQSDQLPSPGQRHSEE